VYRLGPIGAKMLAQNRQMPLSAFRYWGRGDDKDGRQTHVRPNFLEHGLMLTTIRLAFEHVVSAHKCAIETWQDDWMLRGNKKEVVYPTFKGRRERIPINPDGYFVLIAQRGKARFFLEADRSTETIRKTWRRKILGYKEYVRSGAFARRYGEGKRVSPRILTITLSQQRAKNLRAAAETFGNRAVSQLFWFATLEDVQQNPLTKSNWIQGGNRGAHSIL